MAISSIHTGFGFRQNGGRANNSDISIYYAGTEAVRIDNTDINFVDTIVPLTSDAAALGTGSLMWSDLFLASGGVINFNNGNVTLTHAAGFLTINDDIGLRLGTTGDDVLYHRTTTLNANTAITSVHVGTPVSQALAANSMILSNVTASGDIAILVNNGGNSHEVLHADGSGDTVKIGHGLAGVTVGPNSGSITLDSVAQLAIDIGGVGAIRLDDAAIASFAGAGDTAGQDIYIETQDGGAASGNNNGVAGGLLSVKTGDGTAPAGTGTTGGAGGASTAETGAGAAGSATGTGGAGGQLNLTTGAGGGTSGAGTGGAGGDIVVTLGAGGTTTGGTDGAAGRLLIGDDRVLGIGAGGDGALYNRSTSLGANTALTNVFIGTPVVPALAANSLIISNITSGGQLVLAANSGGNSQSYVDINPGSSLNLRTHGGGGIFFYVGTSEGLRMTASRYWSTLGGNPANVAAAGSAIWGGGIAMTDVADAWIDDATHGTGTTTHYIGNQTITTSSDVRVKTDVETWVGRAVDFLRGAPRQVQFKYNLPGGGSQNEGFGPNARGTYRGWLAQETVDWAPWIINAGAGKDCLKCRAGKKCKEHPSFWHVNYEYLVPMLVQAVNELSEKVFGGQRPALKGAS